MELLADGIDKELLLDGKVILFTISTVNQKSVDLWYAHLQGLIGNWSAEQPYLVVYDMTHPDVTLTAYMRKHATEISAMRQEVKGRIAIVLKPDPFTYVFKFFLKTLRNRSRQTAIFFDRQTAIKWVSLELRD